ncbi:hypothetical protein [Mobilibacterium timonense]|uniref:hypothetical protein n=1 Tax=Mobilibacterium timonense TaxID=1871012 RepID=UPI0009871465|nr:hypothetical protein [Mobilibacterium timonense]
MRRPKYKSEADARIALRRSVSNLHRLARMINGPGDFQACLDSFLKHVEDMLESANYLHSRHFVSPDGKLPLPWIKHLFDEGDAVNAPDVVRAAARGIDKGLKQGRKGGFDLWDLKHFIKLVDSLGKWLISELKKFKDPDWIYLSEGLNIVNSIVGDLGDKYFGSWLNTRRSREIRHPQEDREMFDHPERQYFILNRRIDYDSMSEEEIDEFYRRDGRNGSKSMAPAFIFKILQERTSDSHHLTQQEISAILGDEYEVTLERKALTRNLRTLSESDLGINADISSRTAEYWYSPETEERERKRLEELGE